ncbi:MAG: hypothetical protein JNK82_10045 [Myxococcaceae bacterium]|nr:hypothetical protein [Myxococcaceae bacterium]
MWSCRSAAPTWSAAARFTRTRRRVSSSRRRKSLWHCLGACRIGGSVVDWVMKAEGVNFRHAVELLRAGVDLSGPWGRASRRCRSCRRR